MRRYVLVLSLAVAAALLPALPAAAAEALILSPGHGSVVGRTVTVEVRGYETPQVDVLVDGALQGSDTTGEPYAGAYQRYTVTLDLSGLSGQHSITAVARAGSGGTEGRDTITVTVDGVAPTIQVPSTVSNSTRATILTASEPMRSSEAEGAAVYRSSTGTVVPALVLCAKSATATGASGCSSASTATRYLYVRAKTPLVTGERYTLELGPTVTDVAGNRPAVTRYAVRAATVLSDEDGIAFRWRQVADSRARGGSYVVSNDPGSVGLTVSGASRISLMVVKGPSMGVLQLSGGGTTKRVDLYSPTVQFGQQVAYDFGCGTSCFLQFLTVEVTGSRNPSSRGVAGAVDAVLYRKSDGAIAEYPFVQGWARAYQSGATASVVRQSSTPSSYAEAKVRTTRIDWTTVVGPDQGMADVYVDGRRVARFDNWAASRALAHRYVSVADGVHTVRIVPTGLKRSTSRAARVSVERIAVR